MNNVALPKKVGIVGLGAMGAAITYVLAYRGVAVVGVDISDEAVQRGRDHIDRLCSDASRRGKLMDEDASELDGRVTITTKMEALADCDLIIEAVPEDTDVKAAALQSIDAAVGESTVIATNTSTLSVTMLSKLVSNPGRFLGVHFFHPPEAMRLVEVIAAPDTAAEVVARVISFLEAVGKDVVQVVDRPGFLVNAVLISYLNQAIDELDGHLADPATIDTAIRLGLGYPIGPYEMLDNIGLDTQLAIAENAYAQTHRPEHAPPPLLQRLVSAGRLGNKVEGGIRSGQEQTS